VILVLAQMVNYLSGLSAYNLSVTCNMVYLKFPPFPLGPVAFGDQVDISGRPLMPNKQNVQKAKRVTAHLDAA